MSYQVSFTPEANGDLTESTSWYSGQKPGLGRIFYRAVANSVGVIAETPFLFTMRYKGVRAGPVKNFPFTVFYLVEEIRQVVVIIAVLHNARNPMVWKDRA